VISRRVRPILLGLALLDLVVFGGWITREELARRSGPEILLPIEGYDPRDLLSGHYLRFALVASREALALETASAPRGLGFGVDRYCLERGADGRDHVTRRMTEGEPCATFLTGQRTFGRINFGVDRVYIDERFQNETIGTNADPDTDTYLRVRVDGGGRVHIVDLILHGLPRGAH
jgi:uncharacterized membrane-anchored protein